jgi:hypothetical protein
MAQAVGADSAWLSYAEDPSLIASVAQVGGHQVKVALRPGILDTTAPAGGMLYNLERRGSH